MTSFSALIFRSYMLTFFHSQNGWNFGKYDEFGEENPRFRPSRYTLAAELPTKEELLKLAMPEGRDSVEIRVGFTCVHPDDNYNKEIGRELAKNRMKPVVFTFRAIHSKEGINPLGSGGRILVLESRPDQMSYVGELNLTLLENMHRPIISNVQMYSSREIEQRAEWYKKDLELKTKGSS